VNQFRHMAYTNEALSRVEMHLEAKNRLAWYAIGDGQSGIHRLGNRFIPRIHTSMQRYEFDPCCNMQLLMQSAAGRTMRRIFACFTPHESKRTVLDLNDISQLQAALLMPANGP